MNHEILGCYMQTELGHVSVLERQERDFKADVELYLVSFTLLRARTFKLWRRPVPTMKPATASISTLQQ